MDFVLKILWWFLPAYAANVAPVLTAKMNLPGGSAVCEPCFGSNKTWRGLYSGVLGAMLMLLLQSHLQSLGGLWVQVSIMDYQELSLGEFDKIFLNYSERLVVWSVIFGLGTILGDMLGSYIKRHYQHKKPGEMSVLLDQWDFVFGVWVFSFLFFEIDFVGWIIIAIATLLLQPTASAVAYVLGIKNVWY